MQPTLATRLSARASSLRSDTPLTDDQMRRVAPSIFAEGKHASRSERYTYIPTIEILRGLSREGFAPYMVAQGHSRVPGKAAYTKHMIRMRHALQVRHRPEANEIILINSHDGASSYQMLAGAFRFVCCNGLVVGDVVDDIRIPHKGQVEHEVIDGAFRVLAEFEVIDAVADDMKALPLDPAEQRAFAKAALALRYGGTAPADPAVMPAAPITAERLLEPRRAEDVGRSLWQTFQTVQENATKGGQPGRTATGHRTRTRPIANIDRSVSLNRALWVLADEMRRLKG